MATSGTSSVSGDRWNDPPYLQTGKHFATSLRDKSQIKRLALSRAVLLTCSLNWHSGIKPWRISDLQHLQNEANERATAFVWTTPRTLQCVWNYFFWTLWTFFNRYQKRGVHVCLPSPPQTPLSEPAPSNLWPLRMLSLDATGMAAHLTLPRHRSVNRGCVNGDNFCRIYSCV